MPQPIDWTVGIPARTLLNKGSLVSGKFPLEGVSPRQVLYRVDETNITNYIVYDDNGRAIKRVDLTGKSHANIPTPHVVLYNHNKSPMGMIFVKATKTVRPARLDEIP